LLQAAAGRVGRCLRRNGDASELECKYAIEVKRMFSSRGLKATASYYLSVMSSVVLDMTARSMGSGTMRA
jgi:hypothetical protein